ncbi:unnamed protein product, partial [Closterium sp. NIES-54]
MTTLAALGFAPSSADPSLFLRTDTALPPFYVLVHGRSAATAGGSRRGLGGLGSSDGFSPDYQPYPANSYAATFRSGPLPPTTSGAIRRSPAGYLPVTASGSSFHGDGGYYPTLTGSSLSLRYLTGSPLSSRHHLTESPLSLQHHLSESPLSRNTTIHSLDISQRRPRRTISQLPDFPGFQQDLRGASATVGGGGNGGGKRVVFVERVSSDSPLRVQTQQAGYDHDSGFASCASFASPVGNFNSPGDARHSANGRRGGGGGRGDGGAGGGCGENVPVTPVLSLSAYRARLSRALAPAAPAVASPLLSRPVPSPLLSGRPSCSVPSPLPSRRPCCPVLSRRPCCPVPSPLPSRHPCCPVSSRRPCCPVVSPPAVPFVPPRHTVHPVPSVSSFPSRSVTRAACALPLHRAPCALPVRRAPVAPCPSVAPCAPCPSVTPRAPCPSVAPHAPCPSVVPPLRPARPSRPVRPARPRLSCPSLPVASHCL